ncbi:hypothetical protein CDA63_11665 [Hymenobacter amundsenii]|uniref:Resolvase HTH domain-containing protein n=1 Tax=Hymenobacter amundsenii TaxID=2006685 RepID=A0A246FK01_9BACT|nr:hypothetical protein CDA63_11665 [Hymenobacter amundsenii]
MVPLSGAVILAELTPKLTPYKEKSPQQVAEGFLSGRARKKQKAEEKGEVYMHGRRALAPELVNEIRQLQSDGLSVRKISAAINVPVGTVHKYMVAKN